MRFLVTSSEITENKLTFKSKLNELIYIFNIKTKQTTEAMQGLHFSTIDLRNKLSKCCITDNCPIIAQVATGKNVIMQVRVEIYPLTFLADVKYEATCIRK